MKVILPVVIVFIILITAAIYYLYPTLYGVIPQADNTPRLSDLVSYAPGATSDPKQNADIPAETIIAEGLDTPWAIAFLPDRSMLVTERKGTIRLVSKEGQLQNEPVATISNAKEIGEGGLLGIALDPEFSNNQSVYLYYTYNNSGENTLNRVVKMKYADGKLSDEQILVDQIPGASNHNGGRIKFGPGDFLYITTGDAQEPSHSQDKNSLAGKILRITTEGKPAPGNPYIQTGGPFQNLDNPLFSIYSMGHRNPQGLAWDEDGNLWETEHGPSGGSLGTGNDEINVIEIGNNYGWPVIQGDQTKEGMITPVKNSTPQTSWAPGGAAIFGHNLYFGGLKGQALYKASIDNGKITDFQELLKGKYGRIREVILGPDGMLYITTSNRDGRGIPKSEDDRIIRINPAKL